MVEQHRVPADHRHLFCGRVPGGIDSFLARGGEEVESGINAGRSGGNFYVEGPAVLQVAPPLERLAIEEELQSGKIFYGAGRPMLARNPFGVIKRERTRAG